MRYVFRFLCVCALGVVQLPQSASAQAGEKGTTSEPNLQEPAASAEPAREEGASRLERWHPEAFADPAKPASKPALQLGLDSAGLEVTPTAPPTLEQLERRAFEDLERLEKNKQEKKKPNKRRRAIGIGVGVAVGVVLLGVLIGGAVAVSNMDI